MSKVWFQITFIVVESRFNHKVVKSLGAREDDSGIYGRIGQFLFTKYQRETSSGTSELDGKKITITVLDN